MIKIRRRRRNDLLGRLMVGSGSMRAEAPGGESEVCTFGAE
jgi:hypothetical protein